MMAAKREADRVAVGVPIHGWENIAIALGRLGAGYVSSRTVQRWHDLYGLPLTQRKCRGRNGRVSADSAALEAWWRRFNPPLGKLRAV